MIELREPFWRTDALAALKLLAPPESRQWLDEVYVLDPAQIRRAFSDRSEQIAQNFKWSALRWEEQKRKEADEAAKAMRKSERKGEANIPNDDCEDVNEETPPE